MIKRIMNRIISRIINRKIMIFYMMSHLFSIRRKCGKFVDISMQLARDNEIPAPGMLATMAAG